MKVDAMYQVHWANSLSNLAFAERSSKAVSTRSTLITSGLYKNNFTRGFFVLSVATVNMAKMAGRADVIKNGAVSTTEMADAIIAKL